MRVWGAIFAGGRGSRLGGADKALLPVAGRPMAAWVADSMAGTAERVVAIGGRDLAGLAALGLERVPDLPRFAALPGQFRALGTALALLEAEGDADWLLTAPTDMPLLPHSLWPRLLQAGAPVAFAQDPVQPHATLAAWSRPAALMALAALDGWAGESLLSVLLHAGGQAVPVEAVLPNVNTRADLDGAEATLRSLPGPHPGPPPLTAGEGA